MRYVLLNNGTVVIADGEEERIASGTLKINFPFPCDVVINGFRYNATVGTIYVPVSTLKSINSVSISDKCGKPYNAERFRYDNGSVIPCGYDFRESIIALTNMVSIMKEQIADMRHILVAHNEAITQSELF